MTDVIGRREWAKKAAIVGGTVVAMGCKAPGDSGSVGVPGNTAALIDTGIVCRDDNAVVETTAGKVRGYTRNGIHTFKGVPYGATTEGEARYLPCSKPKPWTEVRSALSYGKCCPQALRGGWEHDEETFVYHWDDGQPGENCLHVNVWTPGLDSKKRPVMFWIHGGGYQAGSSQELPGYPGENMSRRGDVVVVALNHRLGVFGFLNLAGYGPPYADSANLGMLDIVGSLEWVRDNIANFGGDPGNVTIFGQSGGGGKVTNLMTMPSAKGLFHKAIVQSGSLLWAHQPADSAKLADAVVAELGLTKAQIAKIHSVPSAKLLEAAVAAVQKLSPPPKPGDLPRLMWMPTADGKVLPNVPFIPAAPEISANIPMIIGTVLHEFSPTIDNPKAELMTEAELKKQVSDRYGDKAGRILEVLHKAYPGQKPVGLSAILGADMFRSGAAIQAERKAAQGAAPAYVYLFTRESPVLNGRARAYHCAEIPFVFYNTDLCDFATGGGPEARELAGKMCDAWISFARKGDPNHPGLPTWPAYEKEKAPVMIFDKVCEVKTDPEKELRPLLRQPT
jgi:para-nitrobenzyl esterase